MKKATFLFFLVFSLLCNSSQAQFKKALTPSHSVTSTSEAKYNIGLLGGLNSTYWVHFGGTKTPYKEPFNFGLIGGLAVERMLDANTSIGIEGIYAMRNLQINYEVLNFPVALNQNKNYYRQLDVEYQEVDVQVPLTHYFSKSNMRPYVFVAPRVSIPLSGKMIWQKTEILDYGTVNQQLSSTTSIDTVELNAQNTWQCKGTGVQKLHSAMRTV